MTDERPPLTVLVPTREPWPFVRTTVDSLLSQARRTGTEILVVDGGGRAFETEPEPPVRWVRATTQDIFALRSVGVRETRGEILAIGEDHLSASPDWCEAILRAHREHPEADAVVGALHNVTDATTWARAHMLAFAAPYEPPIRELPTHHAPPISAISIKRRVLGDLPPGDLEVELIPRLFHEGRMVLDDRIVGLHRQAFSAREAIAEQFNNGRTIAGYLRPRYTPAQRRQRMGWAIRLPAQHLREARERHPSMPELAAVAVLAGATALGDLVGIVAGPGRSPDRFG